MSAKKAIVKRLRYYTGGLLIKAGFGKYLLPLYKYHFSPQQLSKICEQLLSTKETEGIIVEIGCWTGNSTIFLNKFMDFEKMEKPYVCIDSFSGFTKKDLKVEKQDRNKKDDYNQSFVMNSKKWFEETMRNNRIKRVTAIEADICEYEFDAGTKISFAFLDVDLYRPTQMGLDKIYSILSPGGVIVVDDCIPSNKWDGALQAYKEFIQKHNMPEEYLLGKLGVIKKTA